MTDIFLRYGKQVSPLDKYRKNIYSQNGEDGIVEEILVRIGQCDPQELSVVEFGAWDGKYLSNTFRVIEQGARAILIEGDPERFNDLLETQKEQPKIRCVNEMVSIDPSSESSLNAILRRTGADENFDILSIDIDSYDLDVWEGLEGYWPNIVIIEITSEIPLGVTHIYSDGSGVNSFSAAVSIGKKKGYSLVAHVGNLIFVKNELARKVIEDESFLSSPDLLYNDFWCNMRWYFRLLDRVLSFMTKHGKTVRSKLTA